jgi:hypothetical protein
MPPESGCPPVEWPKRSRRNYRHASFSRSKKNWRHTYGFYRLAQTSDIAQVAVEMGLPPGPYRKVLWHPISMAEAEEFFTLTPEACGRPTWNAEVTEWLDSLTQ